MSSHLIETFVADMELRGYRPCTIMSYRRAVRKYLTYCGDDREFSLEHAKAYLLHLIRDQEAGPAEHKMHAAALKCFYEYTLGKPEVAAAIPIPKVPKSLPDILSGSEVEALLIAVEPLCCRMVVTASYAAGLRIQEACRLRTTDIDSKRMVIHLHEGKGGVDRYVMLSKRLLEALRVYYKLEQPGHGFLFPSREAGRPISPEKVRRALRQAVIRCNLHKRVTPHILRHCFATHLIETGTDLRVVQALLGHGSIRSTVRYTRVSRELVSRTTSPYDLLETKEAVKKFG